MSERNHDAVSTADREIRVTRVLSAPRNLVFTAWTDPNHLAHWWGPNGFTTTTFEFAARPGGVWRFMMHGPEGVDYPNTIAFVEVVKPERLVYDHIDDTSFRTTVTFADQGDKTLITVQMVFQSAEQRDQTVKEFNAVEGLNQTLNHLEEHLVNLQ